MVDRDGTRHVFGFDGLDVTAGPIATSVNGLAGLSTFLDGLLTNPVAKLQSLDLQTVLANPSLAAAVNLSAFGTKSALCVDARYTPPAGVHVAMWRYVLVDLLDSQAVPNSACSTLIAAPPGPAGAVALGYATVRPDRVTQTFGFDGRLLSLSDGAGNKLAYTYTAGRLSSIHEPGVSGCTTPATGCRALRFTYNGDASVITVTDPADRRVIYTKTVVAAKPVLTSVRAETSTGQLLEQWAYRYDDNGTTECSTSVAVLCEIDTPRVLDNDPAATEPVEFDYTSGRVSSIVESGSGGDARGPRPRSSTATPTPRSPAATRLPVSAGSMRSGASHDHRR